MDDRTALESRHSAERLEFLMLRAAGDPTGAPQSAVESGMPWATVDASSEVGMGTTIRVSLPAVGD